jgi:hypothetical protein
MDLERRQECRREIEKGAKLDGAAQAKRERGALLGTDTPVPEIGGWIGAEFETFAGTLPLSKSTDGIDSGVRGREEQRHDLSKARVPAHHFGRANAGLEHPRKERRFKHLDLGNKGPVAVEPVEQQIGRQPRCAGLGRRGAFRGEKIFTGREDRIQMLSQHVDRWRGYLDRRQSAGHSRLLSALNTDGNACTQPDWRLLQSLHDSRRR